MGIVSPNNLSTSILAAESWGSDVFQNEVRLVESGGEMVVFKATPELEESGSTLYIQIDEGRLPASFLIYMGSPSRTFNINAKFISRTVEEADLAFKYKSLIQAWRMPLQAFGDGLLGNGATPRVVRLWGYNKMFMGIPTVVRSYSFTHPSDVDYIADSNGNYIPIIWSVNISLLEAHTIEDIKAFDYGSYKMGELEEWS